MHFHAKVELSAKKMEAWGGGREKWKPFLFLGLGLGWWKCLLWGLWLYFTSSRCCCFFFLLSNVISFSVFTLSLDIKGLETSIYDLPPSTVNILGMRSIGKSGLRFLKNMILEKPQDRKCLFSLPIPIWDFAQQFSPFFPTKESDPTLGKCKRDVFCSQ